VKSAWVHHKLWPEVVSCAGVGIFDMMVGAPFISLFVTLLGFVLVAQIAVEASGRKMPRAVRLVFAGLLLLILELARLFHRRLG
jgi:hypothetical protein